MSPPAKLLVPSTIVGSARVADSPRPPRRSVRASEIATADMTPGRLTTSNTTRQAGRARSLWVTPPKLAWAWREHPRRPARPDRRAATSARQLLGSTYAAVCASLAGYPLRPLPSRSARAADLPARRVGSQGVGRYVQLEVSSSSSIDPAAVRRDGVALERAHCPAWTSTRARRAEPGRCGQAWTRA